MRKDVERFQAISGDGEQFTVIHYQQENWFTPVNGPRQRASVIVGFELADDGGEVIQLDAKTFKIVETDMIIRKV